MYRRFIRIACALACGLGVLPAMAQNAVYGPDKSGNHIVELSELLRVIQFYNVGSYHCDGTTEDGYAPGPGAQDCPPYDVDYQSQNWSISLSELLRPIQFYNAQGYYDCVTSEDGFCAGKPANVVYILVDTFKANRIGAVRNNLPISPYLTQLAAEGARFTHAVSPSSWTRPSMASYFTGKYAAALRGPQNTPVDDRFNVLPEDETLAEWFGENGYARFGVQTNREASPVFGMDAGFDSENYIYNNGFVIASMLSADIDTLRPKFTEPFFLFAQYVDPHTLYAPPVEYTTFFGPQPVPSSFDNFSLGAMQFYNFFNDLYTNHFTGSTRIYPDLTDNGKAAVWYRYDAEVRYLDDELAKMIGSIRTQYPKTIFVIVSDHGESLLDRDILGHGHTVFDEQIRVPLIMQGPGIQPEVITDPVEALGIAPTLAKLLNLAPSPAWQSRDLFSYEGDEPVFSYLNSFYLDIDVTMATVTQGNLKLIKDDYRGKVMLFDLAVDPGELNDLSESRPADTASLLAILEAHLEANLQ